jgi:hypothetical protein
MSGRQLRKEKNCLNCGYPIDDRFCSHCGQENIEVKEPALGMIIHTIADYFHFEHKFFSTFRPLLFKPGFLSKKYISGKRESYINPIRLYIFISILFFLVILTDKHKPTESQIDSSEQIKPTLVSQDTKGNNFILAKPDASSIFSSVIGTMFGWQVADTTIEAYKNRQATLSERERDGSLKKAFIEKSLLLKEDAEKRDKFTEHLRHNFPKIMFLLLPVFALILKLVFLNSKKYYYEHFIYSLHVHSAIFLAILFVLLLKWTSTFLFNIRIGMSWILIIYILWYIYRSLRTFYENDRRKTILKMSFLFLNYAIVFIFCLLLISAFTFAS